MVYYGNWNWKNCWRITFILILLSAFFYCMQWEAIAKCIGTAGGIAFILMFVIRFDDVKEWGDRNETNNK